ncbi:MAG: hypothetical protein PHI31_00130 [Desulfuromonadaceae bacterium]|nr:hypothetical protein [Desulfuromonadaceae bacterium]
MKSLFIGIVLLLSCSQAFANTPSELDTYYPLEVGSNWIYSYRLLGLQQQSVKSYDEVHKGYVLETKSRAGGKHLTVVQKNEKSVDRVADIGQNGAYVPLATVQAILSTPLKKGTTWEYSDNASYKQEFKVVGFVKMTVNAGRFSKVLKIEKRIVNLKDKNKNSGKYFLYYAPNVGLIKEEFLVKEGERSALVMELASFHPANKRKK